MAVTKNADLAEIAFKVQWGNQAAGYGEIFAFDYTIEDAEAMNGMSEEDYMEAVTHLGLSEKDVQERREWYGERDGFADTDWVYVWKELREDFAEEKE